MFSKPPPTSHNSQPQPLDYIHSWILIPSPHLSPLIHHHNITTVDSNTCREYIHTTTSLHLPPQYTYGYPLPTHVYTTNTTHTPITHATYHPHQQMITHDTTHTNKTMTILSLIHRCTTSIRLKEPVLYSVLYLYLLFQSIFCLRIFLHYQPIITRYLHHILVQLFPLSIICTDIKFCQVWGGVVPMWCR